MRRRGRRAGRDRGRVRKAARERETNQTDEKATRELVARVVAMAKVAPEDPEQMPLLPAQTYVTVPAAFDRAIAEMSSESRASTAQTAIATARQAGLNGAGFLELSAGEVVLANSAGLRATYRDTFGSFSMTARTKDASGSGWAIRASHEARAIDAAAVARAAADKAVRSRRRARSIRASTRSSSSRSGGGPARLPELAPVGPRRRRRALGADEARRRKPARRGDREPDRHLRSDPVGPRDPGRSVRRRRVAAKAGHLARSGRLTALQYSATGRQSRGKSRRRSATCTSPGARRSRSTSSSAA